MNTGGVYAIINLVDNKMYYGSTANFKVRWDKHIRSLRSGTHTNSYLQSAWNKHGEKEFMFVVAEYVNADLLLQREQWYLDFFKTWKKENGYNISRFALSPFLGLSHSSASRKKISDGNKNKVVSKETGMRISNSLRGKRRSDETKEKIRISTKGTHNHGFGKHLSVEHKIKIGRSLLGQRRLVVSKTKGRAIVSGPERDFCNFITSLLDTKSVKGATHED